MAAAVIEQQNEHLDGDDGNHSQHSSSRRSVLMRTAATATATLVASLTGICLPSSAKEESSSIKDLFQQLQQAEQQLNDIPKLIDGEKWDSVRAILIAPPLSDCWAKTNRPLLKNYAEALGEIASGDYELAALEAKEELQGHLRYLDMAVYNNNFNPITVEGKTGASATLISSYYEDPKREFQASRKALQELIGLAKEAGI